MSHHFLIILPSLSDFPIIFPQSPCSTMSRCHRVTMLIVWMVYGIGFAVVYHIITSIPCVYDCACLYEGFLKWGYPHMDGLYGKIPLKWMMNRCPYCRKPPYQDISNPICDCDVTVSNVSGFGFQLFFGYPKKNRHVFRGLPQQVLTLAVALLPRHVLWSLKMSSTCT